MKFNAEKDRLSLLVPCFNEEDVVVETHKRIMEVMKKNFPLYEIIYINDGSVDKTLEILKGFCESNPFVKVIDFSRNFGHQNAVTAGINSCQGKLAVIIDADLQDPPEMIPGMVEMYKNNNCNIVYGQRTKRKGETFLKKITAILFYRILNYFSDVQFPVDTGDFRLIDKTVINSFNELREKNKYIRGLISWLGFKQIAFPYLRQKRFAGETKYTLKKMTKLAKAGIFSFSKKPLLMASKMGGIAIFVALILLVYVFYQYFFEPGSLVPGWASLAVTMLFFNGITMIFIGILGEYIGNIFEEIKDRPEYVIRSRYNFEEE